MKCIICGRELSDNAKFCQYCGRIITQRDRDEAKALAAEESERPRTYRPASTAYSDKATEKTIHMPAVKPGMSSEEPVYRAPVRSRATDDIEEYDRQFMSNDSYPADTYQTRRNPNYNRQTQYTDDSYNDYDTNDYTNGIVINPEDDYPEDERTVGTVTRGGKESKPHLKFNGKAVLICIAVLVGIAICVMGVYQIGKQFDFWGTTEPQSGSAAEQTTEDKTMPEPATTEYRGLGIYTVTSTENNICMYKNSDDTHIFASVPKNAVLDITEINGEFGKTVYGTNEGWVYMSDLSYTPNATVSKENTSSSTTTETTTVSNKEPGKYTVTTNGDSSYLNLRDASSTDGKAIYQVPNGTEVTVEKTENGWGYITYDGMSGWVYMSYLK